MAGALAKRREIERALHDGVQQDLVALAVNVQLAQELAGTDQAALTSVLATMRRDVRDAIAGVRTLARVVYPPLLDDLGLVEALRAASGGVGFPVRIAANVDRQPADVEATVYLCCVEALAAMAAARPSGQALLRLWQGDGSLSFEIVAEGSSRPRDEGELGSLRLRIGDWLGAVDGTAVIHAERERTILSATVPVPRASLAILG